MLTLIHFSYKNMTLYTKRLFWQAWCFQNEKKSILGIAWGENQQTVFIRTTRTIGTKPSGTLDVLSEKIAQEITSKQGKKETAWSSASPVADPSGRPLPAQANRWYNALTVGMDCRGRGTRATNLRFSEGHVACRWITGIFGGGCLEVGWLLCVMHKILFLHGVFEVDKMCSVQAQGARGMLIGGLLIGG